MYKMAAKTNVQDSGQNKWTRWRPNQMYKMTALLRNSPNLFLPVKHTCRRCFCILPILLLKKQHGGLVNASSGIVFLAGE